MIQFSVVLPMIRWSFGWFVLPMIRWSCWWFCLPMIRWSNFGFFVEYYMRSDDHISVFLPKIADSPMIIFWFFCRKLSDDHISVFFAFFTEDLVTFGFQSAWLVLAFLGSIKFNAIFLCNISHTTRWLWWWSWHIISHVQWGVSHHNFFITILLSPSPPRPPPQWIFHYPTPTPFNFSLFPSPTRICSPPNKVKSWALNAN